MIAAAATRGDVVIRNVIPKHLDSISAKLLEMGVEVEEYDDCVRINAVGKTLKKINFTTMPYPGFPTDMQPQIATMLTIAKGRSIITENVFESRYRYTDELKRMGADISIDGRVAIISGVDNLSGAVVRATDLRAGAAMIIAGLAAKGMTTVEEIVHIERGYEDIVGKLRAIGADIVRMSGSGNE
jgi:UDP-N-acetylglucosamine 1-carboxyvinyltransferase